MKNLELNKIYNMDCLEFMKTLPDKCIDLVLTDPPYGIGADKGIKTTFGSSTQNGKVYKGEWDKVTPSKEYFDEMFRVGKNVIIFGGNFFTDKLPVNGHWIVWDKKGDIQFNNPFGDCELAYTNINRKSVKKYTIIQQGFISKEIVRFHPTQKPLELFSLILKDYSEKSQIIFDPFLGGGTTALACKQMGRNYIGCEISKEYCDIAEQRIKAISNPLF